MVNSIKNAWSSKERKTEEDIVGRVAVLKTAKIVKTVRLIDSVQRGGKQRWRKNSYGKRCEDSKK